jgi:hypothetical protein
MNALPDIPEEPVVTLAASADNPLPPETAAFYREAIEVLRASEVPFLLGGAYAFACYTGIERHTKDLDVFVRPEHAEQTLAALAGGGFVTELTFPHWLGKAFQGENFIDVIFGSGNGLAVVDDAWFAHAVPDEVLGLPVRLIPPEEMLWSKAFVMERERYDGADVNHLLRATASDLEWDRLLWRFGAHWPVLLSHLVLFGYVYPAEARHVPDRVMRDLLDRIHSERDSPGLPQRICRGPFLSRSQYLIDLAHWGYADPRLCTNGGAMTPAEIRDWTAGIARDGS